MNETIVDNNNLIKLAQTLPFDIVAVPQTNISHMLHTATDSVPEPVNIKIKVKNKEKMTQGLGVTVPKFSTAGPKKVRLVSSDQTIISFDLFMEKENEKKGPRKPHYKFFKFFKPSGCFNNQNDDDIYPYIPSSSNEPYRAKSTSYVKNLQDDKIFDEKFVLKKNPPPMISNNSTLRIPTFLGKCKPGGCLDPPFGEDKYIYKPQCEMLAIDQKTIEKPSFDENDGKKTKNIAKDVDKPDTSSQDSPSKISIEKIYCHSLITYPLALSSSEIQIQEETQNKKSQLRISSENKVRTSVNEYLDTYFMPPKKQKTKDTEKLRTESSETSHETYNSYDTTSKRETSQKESMLISTNEPFYQVTEKNFLNDNNNNVNVREPNDTDLQNQIFKSSSIMELSVTKSNLIDDTVEKKINSLANPQTKSSNEGSKNDDVKIKIDINGFETNQDISPVTTLSRIYESTMTIENAPITAEDFRISKFERNSNGIIVDNHSLASQDQNKFKSPIENQSLTSNSSVNNDETKIKFERLIPSVGVTMTSSQTNIIEHLPETNNILQVSITESAKLKYSGDHLIEHKESDHSSIKGFIQDKEKTEMYTKALQQNKSLQDIYNTTIIAKKEESDTDNITIKKDLYENKDKNNDQDFTTLILSETAIEQSTDQKSILISSEHPVAKPHEYEKESSAIAADSKSDSVNVLLDNIDSTSKPEAQTLHEKKISSIQNKENNYLKTSLNLASPLTLSEKTSSVLQIQKKDTSDKVPVNNENKISSATSQILKSPSDLSDKATIPTDNLEVHSPSDVVQDLISIVPVDIQGVKDLSTKDIIEKVKSVDKDSLQIKPQSQINNSKVTAKLSDNEMEKYYSSDITASLSGKIEDQSDIISKNFTDFIQNSSNLNIPIVYPAGLEEAVINDSKFNVTKPEEKNVLWNKNSSVKVNLGFNTHVNDKNEIMIKTFDTSKYLNTDPRAKLTIIDAIIRKNDSKLYIPVNSEMNVTLQMKETIDKGDISKREIDDIKKESTDKASRKPIDKYIILQETLASVYENLVPVENIIRELKEEADFLTQQQVLLREMLNTKKTTSVKIINTDNKTCTCNKYFM